MKILSFFSYKRGNEISKTAKVYPFSIVTNARINDYTYISYNCVINNCEIGKFCSIARGVKIGLGKHPLNFISTSPIFYSPWNPLKKILSKELKFKDCNPVTIGNDVWIGANVIILDGITIGNGAVVGANSVVTKDVPPFSIVGGVPAKEIKMRFSKSIIDLIQNSKWWDMPISFFEREEVINIFSKEIDDNSIYSLLKLIRKYKM